MHIDLPQDVDNIIGKLEAAGYEAYAVGGCVRDSILGREPDDWDITTSATPSEIKEIFRRTVDTGIQHGTVTVLMHGTGYEVTTYRIDGIYEDSRHPKEVSFTDDLTKDLERRDFTINAMAYNKTRGLVDVFDGIGDLDRRLIRCVGDPNERFSEDALRMMRAVRFAAQLGYDIDEATASAIRDKADTLAKVSAERIMTELTKLIMSDNPDMLRNCYELGLTAVFLPEFDECMNTPQNIKHHCYNVGEHILHTMKAVRAEDISETPVIEGDSADHTPDDQVIEADKAKRILRFTMMLHDIAKPRVVTVDENGIFHNKGHAALGATLSRDILHRLKADNELIHAVCMLVEHHDWRFEADKRSIRRAMNKMGYDLFPLMIEVQRADIAGQSDYKREDKLARLDEVETLYKEILADKDAVTIKDLAVNGKDLIDRGVTPGPELGEILNRMLDHVIDHPEDNVKDVLIGMFVPG